jgi:hypothetical protein
MSIKEEWQKLGDGYRLQIYIARENLLKIKPTEFNTFLFYRKFIAHNGLQTADFTKPTFTHQLVQLSYRDIYYDEIDEILQYAEPEYLFHHGDHCIINGKTVRVETLCKFGTVMADEDRICSPVYGSSLVCYLNYAHRGYSTFQQVVLNRIIQTYLPKVAIKN